MNITVWSNVATILAGVSAVVALFYAARQIKQNNKIARAQFWLELEKLSAVHDDVHLKLRPGGEWAGESGGPESPKEWAAVEDYMGYFEHCEIMIDQGLIDLLTFKEIFGYRLKNIVKNKSIKEAKLAKEYKHWGRFLSLLKRMEIALPTYQC